MMSLLNDVTMHLLYYHKNFTPSDFHQEVAFAQYFYLNQDLFLCAHLSICLSFLVFRLLQD